MIRDLLKQLKLLVNLRKHDGILSIEDALRCCFRKRDLDSLIKQLCDRRQLLEATAASAGLSEQDLLKYVSRQSGLAVLSKVSSLGKEPGAHQLNLEDFEAVGAIPLMSNGLVVGICCTDPCRLKKVINRYPSLYISLAPWNLIKQALEESKSEISKSKLAARMQVETHCMSAARTCLRLMISEADAFGGESLNLSLTPDKPVYSLMTSDNRHAEGTISSSVVDPLIKLLKEEDTFHLNIGEDAAEHMFKVASSGTDFTVTWKSHSDLNKPLDDKSISRSPKNNFILIVDDSDTFSSVLERFLEQEGYKILKASSAHQALRILDRAENLPGLIVCDLHMPKVDGREFVCNLRKETIYKDIKVVMLTSDDHIDTELSLLSAGADSFLSKIEEPVQLVSKINSLLKQDTDLEAA